MNRVVLVPNLKLETPTEKVTIDPAPLAEQIKPAQLNAQCVPTPFAQAEIMAHVLRAETRPQPETVLQTATLRQTFERWKTLLVGLVLGRITLQNDFLGSSEAVPFGPMLASSRPDQNYLGVLRTTLLDSTPARPATIVGALDPECLVWAAPRLSDGLWATLDNRVGRNRDEAHARQVLAAWREGLQDKGLHGDLAAPGTPVWMLALNRFLDPTSLATDLQEGRRLFKSDVEMVGPTLLHCSKDANGKERTATLYLPVLHIGREREIHQVLVWRPEATPQGVVELRRSSGEGAAAWKIKMSGSADAQHPVEPRDHLLAGVGALTPGDGAMRPVDRTLWLDDLDGKKGYTHAVYDPLLATVVSSHAARNLNVTEDDMERCPALFPDTLRLVRPLRVGSAGRALARYSKNLLSRDPPFFCELLLEEIHDMGVLDPQRPELAVALPGPSPRLTLVERIRLQGRNEEPGEVRALGAVLWAFFNREALFENGSVLRTTGDGSKLVTLPGTSSPLWFDQSLLADVQTRVIAPVGRGVLHEVTWPERVWKRRATLQRFLHTWHSRWDQELKKPAPARDVGLVVGGMCATCFVQWVARTCNGALDVGGLSGTEVEGSVLTLVPGVVNVPIYADVYPRLAGAVTEVV